MKEILFFNFTSYEPLKVVLLEERHTIKQTLCKNSASGVEDYCSLLFSILLAAVISPNSLLEPCMILMMNRARKKAFCLGMIFFLAAIWCGSLLFTYRSWLMQISPGTKVYRTLFKFDYFNYVRIR